MQTAPRRNLRTVTKSSLRKMRSVSRNVAKHDSGSGSPKRRRLATGTGGSPCSRNRRACRHLCRDRSSAPGKVELVGTRLQTSNFRLTWLSRLQTSNFRLTLQPATLPLWSIPQRFSCSASRNRCRRRRGWARRVCGVSAPAAWSLSRRPVVGDEDVGAASTAMSPSGSRTPRS